MGDRHDPDHWFIQAQPDRLDVIGCTICEQSGTEPCRQHDDGSAWYHAGRRWEIGICSPGSGLGGDRLPDSPGRCLPTTEDRWHGAEDDRQHDYRGACLGCGWAGPARNRENDAVEDAHDHCFPGWRQLPTVRRPGGMALEDRKQAARWIEECRKVYAAAGLAPTLLGTGWPLRTERRPMGTRSHWCHVIGGYDLCGEIIDEDPPRRRHDDAVQESLF